LHFGGGAAGAEHAGADERRGRQSHAEGTARFLLGLHSRPSSRSPSLPIAFEPGGSTSNAGIGLSPCLEEIRRVPDGADRRSRILNLLKGRAFSLGRTHQSPKCRTLPRRFPNPGVSQYAYTRPLILATM